MTTKQYLLNQGFVDTQSAFGIDYLKYDIGRDRAISIYGFGTPHHCIYIEELEEHSPIKKICLQCSREDGSSFSIVKLHRIILAITGKSPFAKHFAQRKLVP
jgi:purine-nucleoside phosphorylase